MAKFEITAPDGARYEVEGENEQGALAALQSHLGASAPAAAPSQWENFKRGLSALVEDPRRAADLDMVKSATGAVQTPTNVATGRVGVPQSFGPDTPDAQADPAIGFGANTGMFLTPGAPARAAAPLAGGIESQWLPFLNHPVFDAIAGKAKIERPMPAAPAVEEAAPMTLTVRPSGVEPSGPEAVEAAQRLSDTTGEAVPVSKALASDSMATQRIAAGLKHIPLAGDALVKSGEETAAALGRAADKLAADRGALPPEAAGEAAKEGLADFVGPRTDAELEAAYSAVPTDPALKGPLENTLRVVNEIKAERDNAFLTGNGKAVSAVENAITPRVEGEAPTVRTPGGSVVNLPESVASRIVTPKPKATPRPLSLAEFIASNGGLELTPDAAHAGFHQFRTGRGTLARKDGLSIDDHWRHTLMEEGYLPRDLDGYHSRDIRGELFDKLEAEAKHGQKSYSAKDEAAVADYQAGKLSPYDKEVEAQAKRIRRELKQVGVDVEGTDTAALYDAAEALVHGHESDPLNAYEASATSLGAHGAVPDRGAAVAEAKPKGEPPHLNYEGIKRLRTEVGGMFKNPPEGTSFGELKRIYGALSDDLKAAAAANGGEAQFKAANDLTRQRKVEARLLAKVIGAKGDAAPAAVYDRLVAMAGSASRADTARLALARKSMKPDAWEAFAGGLIGRLGREPDGRFSPVRFHTAYSNLSESGKSILFHGELRQSLDDIATVGARFKRQAAFGNPSGTAQNVNLAKIVGGALIDPFNTFAVIAGGHVVARALASPVTAKPVAQLVKVASVAPRSSPAVQRAAEALSRALVSNIGVRIAANDLAMIAPPRSAAASGRVEENNEQRKRR